MDLTVFGNEVLFQGINTAGVAGLWVTNGTAGGTYEITGIAGADSNGLFDGSSNPDFTVFDGEVFFDGRDTAGNYGLWMTNGTAAGTHEITGIAGVTAYAGGLEPRDFNVSNGELLFVGDGTTAAGLWVTNGTAAGTYAIGGALGSNNLIGLTSILLPLTVQDGFSGGLTSDVLLQNNASSQIIDWTIQGESYTGYTSFGDQPGWSAVGTGDFTGEGTSDVLLENGGGGVIDWIMQNGQYAGYNLVGFAAGSTVAGTGDLTGNGTDDVLLQNNSSGEVTAWLMQNGAYASSDDIGNAADWQIIGTGDFTGNGTDDVLFENSGGGVVDWIIDDGHYAGYNNVGTAPGYTFAGTGDFTGNGTDDILWQNNSTGEVIAWLMQNGQYAGYNDIGNAAGWKVVGTGDYNGKGTADVLLQNNTTGAVIDWTISNGHYAGYHTDRHGPGLDDNVLAQRHIRSFGVAARHTLPSRSSAALMSAGSTLIVTPARSFWRFIATRESRPSQPRLSAEVSSPCAKLAIGIGTFSSRASSVASVTSLCARRSAKSGGS